MMTELDFVSGKPDGVDKLKPVNRIDLQSI